MSTSSSSSFALLRLPFLPLIEVIQNLELKELITLSFCSKKTHSLTKRFSKKSSDLYLGLIGMSHIKIILMQLTDRTQSIKFNINRLPKLPYNSWSTIKLGMDIVKIQNSGNEFDVYYRDWKYGTETLVDYICTFFDKKVDVVYTQKNTIWMMGLVEKYQKTPYHARVLREEKYNVLSDNELRDVLVRRNPRDLDIYHSPSNEFRIDNFTKTYDRLYIENGHWLTIANLLQLDCKELQINKSKLSSREINQYLKYWIEGGAPRLKVFRVQFDISQGDVFYIGNYVREIPGKQVYKLNGDREWTFDGKLFGREDGVWASIQYHRENNFIKFAVWPDFEGNNVDGLIG